MARPLALALLLLAPACAARADGAADVASRPVASGFGFAVNVAFAPDGRMFVADKDLGRIRVVRNGRILPEAFATVDVEPRVNEMGLLGVALHPAFPSEPWVYAYYSDASDGRNRLVRFRALGNVAAERQDLLDLLPTVNGWHNGGDLAFGPDGKLYVTVGEGHDPANAQEPGGLGGRILRLEPDGAVPADNPFGPNDPTFLLGVRNSFGVCFDLSTDELWFTDNGPDRWDEVNPGEPGGNYGWPEHLGPGGEPAFVPPVLAYEETIVPTGCAGSMRDGGLYVGEGYSGRLHRLTLGAESDVIPTDEVVGTFEGGITDVAVGPGNSLYVVTPTTIHELAGIDAPAPSPAPTPDPTGPTDAAPTPRPRATASGSTPTATPSSEDPFRALGTGAGLLVAAVLLGVFLWSRRRAGR